MKYVIMCGGKYPKDQTLRQLIPIKGEPVIKRTIRLLKECGVNDISISGTDDRFEQFDVPLIRNENNYQYGNESSYWLDGFPLFEEPVTYIFGDVVFSRDAIEKIVSTEISDIMFYASAKPFASNYMKKWAEPFAFKVFDNERFKKAINQAKQWQDEGKFTRMPVSWELWQVIQGTPINFIRPDYYAINDFTCDIDNVLEAEEIQKLMPEDA